MAIAPVLKTGGRKPLGVRVLYPPPLLIGQQFAVLLIMVVRI